MPATIEADCSDATEAHTQDAAVESRAQQADVHIRSLLDTVEGFGFVAERQSVNEHRHQAVCVRLEQISNNLYRQLKALKADFDEPFDK